MSLVAVTVTLLVREQVVQRWKERELGYVYVAVTAKCIVFSCVVEGYRASVC